MSSTDASPVASSSFYEKNSQTISNISQLQLLEKELMEKVNNPMLSVEEKKLLVSKMNDLSQTRANLFDLLRAGYDNYKYSITMTANTANDQLILIETTERDLRQARRRLNELENQKQTERRKMEISTYYSKRAAAHTRMVVSAVFLLVVWFGIVLLSNLGILPSVLFNLLSSVLIVIGVFWIGMQWIDVSSRDDMNWDNYNWYFVKDTAPEPSTSSNVSVAFDPWQVRAISCIGAECCAKDTHYDAQANKCVPLADPAIATTVSQMEAFGNIVTKSTAFVPLPHRRAR